MLLPEAFAMRNHFTTKVPFCYIEQDLANSRQAYLMEEAEAVAAGEKGLDWLAPTLEV